MSPLLPLILPPNPSSRRRPAEGRWLLSVSTVTPRDTRPLMMEVTPPPGTKGPDTRAPPDRTLLAGTKVGVQETTMTHPSLMGLTRRAPAGSMVADLLRGLTALTCPTVQ